MNTKIKHVHVLIVKFVEATDSTNAAINIISEYYHQEKQIPFNPNNGGDTCEIAEHWLQSKGFNIIAHSAVEQHYYVITDTFLKLDHYKQIVTKPAK